MKKLLCLLAFALCLFAGCTQVIVVKPNGTRIKVNVLGSTDLMHLQYHRDPNGIDVGIRDVSQTPEGVGEAAGTIIGTAAAAAAGVK